LLRVGYRSVSREEAAQHPGQRGAVEVEDIMREALPFGSFVEHGEPAEQVDDRSRAERQPRAGPIARDLDAVVPPDRADRLERGLLDVDGRGDSVEHGGLARVHGQDDDVLLPAADARAREASVAHGDADPERQIRSQGGSPEAGALQEEAIIRRQVADGHVASPRREHAMVAGDADAIAGAGGQPEHRLSPCREDACHQMRQPVGSDHADGTAHQRVDAAPAVRRGDERVARHARVARVDPPVGGAGVPLVDRGVVLHTGIGAGPRRVGDLVPER
jgi:hypothetical protein